ncbi:transient receptor potential cation channel subfamily M member 1-like isoform X4 [Symsagittifera roscoffensis]|uniref:transient receptor potential cation channel subfamily M member 1-like isoform X4 n=1 Tax=Symsagittifera roscoffensis TaxID=84072 RepID=UPI00307C35E6
MVYINKKHRFRRKITKTNIMFYERRNTRKLCVNFQPSSDEEGQKSTPKQEEGEGANKGRRRMSQQDSKEKRCKGCNYLEKEHFVSFNRPKPWSKVKTWRSDLHLDSVDFGQTGINRKIRLVGCSNEDSAGVVSEVGGIEKTAQLTIVADDTHPLVVVEHLLDDWKLDLPNICISVIGTTGKHVVMPPRYLARLKQGLLSAVSSTSCWVLTGGTNQGVDAIACDALKNAQLTSWMGTQDAPEFEILGIVNWNCISQHQHISRWAFDTNNQSTANKKYSKGENNPNEVEPFEYHVRKATFDSTTGERFPAFNPMCSFFVGVESGIQSNKGAELFVRSSLEELIQADPSDSQHFNGVGLNIPTVLILIGGDFDTFERAANAVEKEIPIILCEGSGLATDIIASGIRVSQKSADFKLSKEQEQVLVKLMETQLSTKPPKGKIFPSALFEGSRHLPFLRKCVKHRKMVFFYRIDLSVSHLDVAIMRALLKSGPARRKDPVQLAVRWNRCDEVVEDHLKSPQTGLGGSRFQQSSRGSPDKRLGMFGKTGFDINEKPNIKELVTQALLEDKPEFIKLFLEHGLDIRKYLTTNQLAQIYEASCSVYPPLVKLLKKARNGKAKSYFKIKHVYNLIHTWTSASLQHQLRTIPDNRNTPGRRSSGDGWKGRRGRRNTVRELKTFEDPFRELCIWAILTHKMEMALFFWSRAKSPLMMALIGSRLWEAHRSALPQRDEEIRLEMEANSLHFSQLAQEMIELSWQVNKQMAQQLVTYKFRAFGRINVMDLAAFIEAKEIIAHPLMQVAIDYMWKAGMRASLQQVLFTFLLPVLLPFRIPIFFRDSSDANPKLTQPSPSSSPSNQLEEGSPSDETSGGGCHEIDEEEEQEDEDEGEEETAFLDQNHQQQHTPIRKMKPMMHRPPSISEFLQEDERTQRLLKAKRELIRKSEVAKMEALRREKKKLLETAKEGDVDVFARAAIALRKIQLSQRKDHTSNELSATNHVNSSTSIKEKAMKDQLRRGARRDSESDSDSEQEGVGGEGAGEGEAGEGDSGGEEGVEGTNGVRTGTLHTLDTNESDMGEGDSEGEMNENENENDTDICKYQVHHLTDDEDYRMHVNEYRQSRDVTTEQSLGGSNTDTSQDLVSPSSLGRQTPQQQGHAHVQQTPRFLSVNKKPRQSKRDNSLSIQMGAPGGVEDGDTKNALVMKAAHLFKNRRSTIDQGKEDDSSKKGKDIEKGDEKEKEAKEKEAARLEALKTKCSELKPEPDEDSEVSVVSAGQMLMTFYTSPISKFCMHTIAYLVFLNLFTISTFETGQGMRSIWGIMSFQFMICYALEAYRQLVTQRANWGMKLRIWAMSEWNIIELVYLSMGLVSFPLTSWEATRNTAIVMNCGINMLMWIRLLRFYQCSSRLGPMWIMIRKMMAETLWFMAIMVVLLFAFGIFIFAVNVPQDSYREARCLSDLHQGDESTMSSSSTIASLISGGGGGKHRSSKPTSVASYSSVAPHDNSTSPCENLQPLFWAKPSYIFLRPYLMSLGNQFLDWTFMGPHFRFTTWMCFFFVVIGNALMLNLLVAIYGGIFNEIVQKADMEWKTEMYWLMKDFKSKTFLPPPISIFETIGLWLHFVCIERKRPVPTKSSEEQDKIASLAILESYCVQTVLDTRNREKTSLDVTNGVIRNREISCGTIQESIQNVHELRTELSNRKHEREEKRRERRRITAKKT